MATKPRTTLADPSADVNAELRAAKAQLNAALLAGADTAPIRAHLAALERNAAKLAAAEAARRAVAEEAEEQAVAARAGEIAAEAASRIAMALDGLQPSPAPHLVSYVPGQAVKA